MRPATRVGVPPALASPSDGWCRAAGRSLPRWCPWQGVPGSSRAVHQSAPRGDRGSFLPTGPDRGARPACVRSTRRSRSNWATAAMTDIVIRPAALVRSTPPRARQWTRTPRVASLSIVVAMSIVFLPRRSSLVTTSTSSRSSRSSSFLKAGRCSIALLPETFSEISRCRSIRKPAASISLAWFSGAGQLSILGNKFVKLYFGHARKLCFGHHIGLAVTDAMALTGDLDNHSNEYQSRQSARRWRQYRMRKRASQPPRSILASQLKLCSLVHMIGCAADYRLVRAECSALSDWTGAQHWCNRRRRGRVVSRVCRLAFQNKKSCLLRTNVTSPETEPRSHPAKTAATPRGRLSTPCFAGITGPLQQASQLSVTILSVIGALRSRASVHQAAMLEAPNCRNRRSSDLRGLRLNCHTRQRIEEIRSQAAINSSWSLVSRASGLGSRRRRWKKYSPVTLAAASPLTASHA